MSIQQKNNNHATSKCTFLISSQNSVHTQNFKSTVVAHPKFKCSSTPQYQVYSSNTAHFLVHKSLVIAPFQKSRNPNGREVKNSSNWKYFPSNLFLDNNPPCLAPTSLTNQMNAQFSLKVFFIFSLLFLLLEKVFLLFIKISLSDCFLSLIHRSQDWNDGVGWRGIESDACYVHEKLFKVGGEKSH